jgi:molecular chaperone DnaK (HSP70)
VKLIRNWPSNIPRGPENAKTPSRLQYFEGTADYTWGYEADNSNSLDIEWFKLLLLRKRDLPEHFQNSPYILKAQQRLEQLKKAHEDVVSDYLRKLWNHTIESMKKDQGADSVNLLPFKVVITIPAMWPAYAEDYMRSAAIKAGILDQRDCGSTILSFISEPEAAALATIRDFQSRDRTSTLPGVNVSNPSSKVTND